VLHEGMDNNLEIKKKKKGERKRIERRRKRKKGNCTLHLKTKAKIFLT
jgi:hypothetical protein